MSGSEEMTAGPVPGVREEVNAFLTREGIPFTGFIHPPIMTVAEGAEIAKRTGGLCCKNLFLKNKKGGFFLLMIPHWKRLDSKELARQIGSARLSFAGEEDLRRLLHLYPGAVSPMGLIFDREGAVQVLLDREIMKHALVDCHPCRNDETLTMTPDDLVNRFMPATGHQVQWVDIPEPEEKPQAGQAQPQQYSAAATRLEQVSQSLASLAETVNDVYETLPHRREDFHWVIDNTHDTLCFNCGRRDTCWKQEYAATLEGMEALRPLLESSGGLETAQLPGQLSRCIHPAALCAAANRSFALYRSRKEARLHAEAMRTALTEQYSAVAEALGVLGEQLGRPGDPEPYKSGRVADFFAQLGTPPQECAVTLDDLGRTHAAVTLPRTRFSAQELAALAGEVGRICRRTLEVPQVLSCKGMTTLLFSEKPVLRAVFGMAGAAARGSISGDAVQQFCSPAAAQMILCDGMGTGRPAAVDGNLAAELTARLLKAGFTAELAARLVNVALALKSEDESGATLDLISVDLYTGTARLFKAGAAPGFLVHGGRVRAVGDTSLPVGILGGVNGQSRVVHLTVGDYAVLVSDGLLVDGPGWVTKQLELSAAAGEAPEKVAKTLVETARVRAQKTGRPDDITAAVLRLEKCV